MLTPRIFAIACLLKNLTREIADIKTVQNMLSDIEFRKLGKVNLVIDQSFYSEANISACHDKHSKFLISTKISLRFVKQKLDQVRRLTESCSYFSSKYNL